MTEIPGRLSFERSAEVAILVAHLRKTSEGDFIPYSRLTEIAGVDDIQGQHWILTSARKILLRDYNLVFGTRVGEGIERLDDSQIVESMTHAQRRQRRAARRQLDQLNVVRLEKLTGLERIRFLMHQSVFAGHETLSKRRSLDKIERRLETSSATMPLPLRHLIEGLE